MKKFYIMIMTMCMVFSLAACGKSKEEKEKEDSNAAVKADVIEFVNKELPAIESDRNTAVSIYNSYFTTDDVKLEQFSSDLQNTAIPTMETYMNNLNSIEVSTDEVKALKDLYVQSAQKQLDAMNKVADSINEEEPDYLATANTLIAESESLLLQYQTQLRTLALDTGITIYGDFSDTTGSEVTP
ncbi:MAG: hypothetical protein IJV15_05890 [Lachnospiraceae bacterium]|nr:hypothetical protein [Lachnospiraceae bacterium]